MAGSEYEKRPKISRGEWGLIISAVVFSGLMNLRNCQSTPDKAVETAPVTEVEPLPIQPQIVGDFKKYTYNLMDMQTRVYIRQHVERGDLFETDTSTIGDRTTNPIEMIDNYYYLGRTNDNVDIHLKEELARIAPVNNLAVIESLSDGYIANSSRDVFQRDVDIVPMQVRPYDEQPQEIDQDRMASYANFDEVKKLMLQTQSTTSNMHLHNLINQYIRAGSDTLKAQQVLPAPLLHMTK